jgi:hypothetical protein
MMVPSRAEWRSVRAGAAGSIHIEAHRVFGWLVHRNIMAPGAVMLVHAAADVPREAAPNRVMYVRGRVTCTCEDGLPRADRVPGTYSGDMPLHPAGTTRLVAVEESEFWCFNWTANRRALPVLEPLRLKAGDSAQGNLLVMTPEPATTDALLCTADTFAFRIKEPR